MKNPRDILLLELCRCYINCLFTMALENKYFDELDSIRVLIHNSIAEWHGFRWQSDDKNIQRLKRIFHALQSHIDFPIIEHAGYGKQTTTRKELEKDFEVLVEKYGVRLYDCLKKEIK